jgi:hypothetical protein
VGTGEYPIDLAVVVLNLMHEVIIVDDADDSSNEDNINDRAKEQENE